MKYFIAGVDEENGEYSYTTSILIKAKHFDSASNKLEKITETWYGGGRDKDDEGYWFDSILVTTGDIKEITKETFTELKGYLTVLPWALEE